MTTTSFWQTTRAIPRHPALSRNLRADVVIVGGGNTGITAAYLMKRAGLKVVLLERGQCAHGDSGHTSAHLTFVTDERAKDLKGKLGIDHARAVWEAGEAAIQMIEDTIQKENIDCDFAHVPGYLSASLDNDADERAALEEDVETAHQFGFSATLVDVVPLYNRPGIRFPNQARFHPLKYTSHLLTLIPGDGSYVFEQSDVENITDDLKVQANGHEVQAGFIFIATDVPLQGKAGLISATLFQSKLMPYTSYVVGAKLPKDSMPDALVWDTSDPYYYYRLERRATHDFAIFGGLDHKTGQEEDTVARFNQLEALLTGWLPEATVSHRWSGQVIEAIDGLPYIGATADNQFVATGFSGNGLTFGTIGAMMACDAVLGRTNPWQSLFDPNRKKLSALWDYVKENSDYPYYMIKDRLKRSESDDLSTLQYGDGRIVKINGERLAVARTKEGKLCAVSSICTHMGCVVHWNNAEKTWDCPCHGSRFNIEGDVMAGPAETPLSRKELPVVPQQ